MVQASDSSAADEDKSSALVDPLLSFTGKIFANAREDKKNIILSPISIHKALNLLLLGADAGSQTRKEIEAGLGYVNSSNADNDNQKYHQAYADIIKVLENLNKDGREAMKELEAKNAAEPGSDESYLRLKRKPTMVEVWSELVTKGKADLKPGYLNETKNYYGSSVERVQDEDPASKAKVIDRVNKWAKEAGFASDLMKPNELDRDFSVLLLSAIRVQAFWFDNFHQMDGENIFYNHGLKDKLVKKGSVLTQTDINGGVYLELTSKDRAKQKYLYNLVQKKHQAAMDSLVSLNARVVQVPMENDIKLTLFEPLDSGNGDELGKMLGQLLGSETDDSKRSKLARAFEIIDDQEMSSEIDFLSLPEFKFESDISIKTPLSQMGINRVFRSDGAELSNITSHKVYVSEAKHQAVIEVNKFGLKAAALTQIRMVPLMAVIKSEPIRVEVKNPFMFIVRHQNIPLFVGQLLELQ